MTSLFLVAAVWRGGAGDVQDDELPGASENDPCPSISCAVALSLPLLPLPPLLTTLPSLHIAVPPSTLLSIVLLTAAAIFAEQRAGPSLSEYNPSQ